ncbi:MAG: heme-binding protein [Moraxellaceae bacterium]
MKIVLQQKSGFTLALLTALLLSGCESDGGGSTPPAALDAVALSTADVQKILAQGINEAKARGAKATFAVTDRVGNVLAVYRMTGAATTVTISSGRGINAGLDGVSGAVPDTLAVISKAITGAYLSSSGNAFSSRTASQIVQENFNPREANQPSGPLFGVQFSQLPCSDLVTRMTDGSIGPKHAPLGLAADPGGLPLYKNGVVVGGVGVMADGLYGLDANITDIDQDRDELIALAASSSFSAPVDIRANRITADGRSFRYVDSETLASNPANAATALIASSGSLLTVSGYSAGSIVAGVNFGTLAAGIQADPALSAQSGWQLTDAGGANRFPPRDSINPTTASGGIAQAEVSELLRQGLGIANRARGQIRRPIGSSAQVSIVIVDNAGEILGLTRTPDAPLFGLDVAVQKARTAMFFSSASAGSALNGRPDASYVSGATSSIANYVSTARTFFNDASLLTGTYAFTPRAIGLIHRPTFPDGIASSNNGPLSKPMNEWSPFNVGLQLDLVYNQLIASLGGDFSVGCTGIPAVRNGLQIFPGGVPIYRNGVLIGAIGVSGDGVDQDDMVALLGVARASNALGGSSPISNAPASIRADQLTPQGKHLRYAQCPQTPFNNSSEQNVCAGL